jgi:hypothetical protein
MRAQRDTEVKTRFGVQPWASALTPAACPVCGEVMPNGKGEALHQGLAAHLQGHAPVEPCPCGGKEFGGRDGSQRWQLDWDLVVHPRPDVGLWFCRPCGRYAKPPVVC